MTLVSIVSAALSWVFEKIIFHSITWLKSVIVGCGQGDIYEETWIAIHYTFSLLKLDLIRISVKLFQNTGT